MGNSPYYSVRMRASLGGRHVSGQERIVKKEELERTILELHRRPKGEWDLQNIKIERLKTPPVVVKKSLPIRDYRFSCARLAQSFAVGLLERVGVNRERLRELVLQLLKGFKNGENLPGAIFVDIETGKVLDDTGTRTVLFDWVDRQRIREKLLQKGYTERTLDALALATKNFFCGVEAEFCISDDPDYTTGYVAVSGIYHRLSPLKEKGRPFGGRLYFVKEKKLKEIKNCLRTVPVLIDELNL